MTASALVEEATRRSSVIWVDLHAGAGPRAAWHVWHGGAAYLVVGLVEGGLEQHLPGAQTAARATVQVRSRERRSGLVVQWSAEVERVPPGTAEWDEVVPVLHAARLNAPDGEEQPRRWARENLVLRLRPADEQTQQT